MSTDIHFCIVLSQRQQNELNNQRSTINRYKCLNTLLQRAQMTEQTHQSKGFKTTLKVGQVAASEVELASLWGCERKSVSRIIDLFNQMGLVSTVSNNRTSVHSILCLSGWIVNGEVIKNPNYIRPSVGVSDNNSNDSTTKSTATAANTDNKHIPIVANEVERIEDSYHGAEAYDEEYFSSLCLDDIPVFEDEGCPIPDVACVDAPTFIAETPPLNHKENPIKVQAIIASIEESAAQKKSEATLSNPIIAPNKTKD